MCHVHNMIFDLTVKRLFQKTHIFYGCIGFLILGLCYFFYILQKLIVANSLRTTNTMSNLQNKGLWRSQCTSKYGALLKVDRADSSLPPKTLIWLFDASSMVQFPWDPKELNWKGMPLIGDAHFFAYIAKRGYITNVSRKPSSFFLMTCFQ